MPVAGFISWHASLHVLTTDGCFFNGIDCVIFSYKLRLLVLDKLVPCYYNLERYELSVEPV